MKISNVASALLIVSQGTRRTQERDWGGLKGEGTLLWSHMGGYNCQLHTGQAEGEGEAGSPLSREQDLGLNQRTLGSWPEPQADAQPTEPPRRPPSFKTQAVQMWTSFVHFNFEKARNKENCKDIPRDIECYSSWALGLVCKYHVNEAHLYSRTIFKEFKHVYNTWYYISYELYSNVILYCFNNCCLFRKFLKTF